MPPKRFNVRFRRRLRATRRPLALAAVEQDGCGLRRRGVETVWQAWDHQRRSSQPVYVASLHQREAEVRIRTDGRGRWMDNLFIERLWRSLKYGCVNLHATETRFEFAMALPGGSPVKILGAGRTNLGTGL